MNKVGTLYIVATPIGNMADITFRAIETLKSVDLILCEDTRVTKKLLSHYSISTKTKSYHAHNAEKSGTELTDMLEGGMQIALVTDAGTPGISDPGALLVYDILNNHPDCKVVSVPGPSALTTSLSISGMRSTEFVFIGFFPKKKGRETLLNVIAEDDKPYVFYESTHRIAKTISRIADHPELKNRRVVLTKELTKMHETIISGTASEILSRLESEPVLQKGEFVVVIDN